MSFYCHNDYIISTNLHPNLSKLLALINDSRSLSNCYNWAPWKITNTPETLHFLSIWEKLTPTEVSDTIYKHRQLCYTVRAISRLSDLYFLTKLTKRESEISPLLLAGITRDEIASSLSVSPRTVNLHTRNILSKFGATTVRDGFYDMNLCRTHYGVGGQGSNRFRNLFQCVCLILPGRQDVRVKN